MSIAKQMIARNAVCDGIVGLVDVGTDYSTGHLSIFTSDATRITWHALSNPAFGSSVDGTSTAYPISDATALVDATASYFAFENRDGTAIWTGDVTLNTGIGSLKLEFISIPQDSTIAISSAKYVVPA
jgi:hypothetical protein